MGTSCCLQPYRRQEMTWPAGSLLCLFLGFVPLLWLGLQNWQFKSNYRQLAASAGTAPASFLQWVRHYKTDVQTNPTHNVMRRRFYKYLVALDANMILVCCLTWRNRLIWKLKMGRAYFHGFSPTTIIHRGGGVRTVLPNVVLYGLRCVAHCDGR